MKFACILITNLAVVSERRRKIELNNNQLIIFHEENKVKNVMENSLDPNGVLTKITLREAIYKYPQAVFVSADKAYYMESLNSVANDLLFISPVIEKVDQISSNRNCIYMNLSGLKTIYKTYENLERHVLNTIPKDLAVRVGISNEKFTSYVAASIGNPREVNKIITNSKDFLKSLSVDFLPIDQISKDKLHEFGLNTLGKIASLELNHLYAQFGSVGETIWKLSNGIDKAKIKPYVKDFSITEKLVFERPISTMNILISGIETIVCRAFSNPHLINKYIRLATLNINMTNKPTWSKTIVFKEAIKCAKKAIFAINTAMNNIILSEEIEGISITFSGISNELGKQYSMLPNIRSQEQLHETMLQLSKRLRIRPPIYKIKDLEPWSRIPERQQALVDFEP